LKESEPEPPVQGLKRVEARKFERGDEGCWVKGGMREGKMERGIGIGIRE
jgi:hypothetical protein